MLIDAIFIIARNRDSLDVNQQMTNKESVLCLHNEILCSNKEKIKFASKWIELGNILSEVTQTQKDKSLMFSFM